MRKFSSRSLLFLRVHNLHLLAYKAIFPVNDETKMCSLTTVQEQKFRRSCKAANTDQTKFLHCRIGLMEIDFSKQRLTMEQLLHDYYKTKPVRQGKAQ